MARRQITSRLNLNEVEYISQAGRDVVTETIGREIGGLGQALGAAYTKAFGNKTEEVDPTPETKEQDYTSTDYTSQLNLDGGDGIGFLQSDPIFTQTGNAEVYSYEKFGEDIKKAHLQKFPGDFEGANAAKLAQITAAKNWNLQTYGVLSPTAEQKQAKQGKVTVNNMVMASYDRIGTYIPGSSIPTKDSTTPGSAGTKKVNTDQYASSNSIGGGFGRNKNVPFARRRGAYGSFGRPQGGYAFLQNDLYKVGPSQPVEGTSDASQYVEGRTFVEKEQELSAPSYMGSAAAQGYNLTVKQRNYQKQVDADMADYLNAQYAGLDVERTGDTLIDDSIQETMMGIKKELANHVNQRQKWFDEGRGSAWTIKMNQLKKVPNDVANFIPAIKESRDEITKGLKEGTYDLAAMSPEQKDELLTIARGGSMLGMANTPRGISMIGETRGKQPYWKSLADVMNGNAAPQVIEKVDTFQSMQGILGNFKKNGQFADFTSMQTIDPATGMKITSPRNFNDPALQNIFTKYIEEELRDNNEARAHASNFGIDYNAYQDMIEKANKGQGPTPKQFIADKMMEQLKGYWPGISGSPKEDVTTMATLKERQAFDAQQSRLDRASKERIATIKAKFGNQKNKQKIGDAAKIGVEGNYMDEDLFASMRSVIGGPGRLTGSDGQYVPISDEQAAAQTAKDINNLSTMLTELTGANIVGYGPGAEVDGDKIVPDDGEPVFLIDNNLNKRMSLQNLPVFFKKIVDTSPMYKQYNQEEKTQIVKQMVKNYSAKFGDKNSAKFAQKFNQMANQKF